MVIWRSYAELQGTAVEILWDNFHEVEKYFHSLRNYSRCNYVCVYEMKSQPDHAIKDTGIVLEWERRML